MNLTQLKDKAREIKKSIIILYLAAKHPETPWYAKLLVAMVISYALSPIDLIPDFIPVLGYLDDLIIVPAGILLALKLIPQPVIEECQLKSQSVMLKGKGFYAAVVIALIWLLVAYLIIQFLRQG